MSATESPGRRVRDESDARALLEELASGGERLKPWCRKKGVSAGSLYWWRSKLFHQKGPRRSSRRSPSPRPAQGPQDVRLAEVVLGKVPPPVARYEVALPNALLVRVDDHFDAEVLTRLLSVVSRC